MKTVVHPPNQESTRESRSRKKEPRNEIDKNKNKEDKEHKIPPIERVDCPYFSEGVCGKGARCNNNHCYWNTSLPHLCLLLDYQIGMTSEIWTRLDRIEKKLGTTPTGHLAPNQIIKRSGRQARSRSQSASRREEAQSRRLVAQESFQYPYSVDNVYDSASTGSSYFPNMAYMSAPCSVSSRGINTDSLDRRFSPQE